LVKFGLAYARKLGRSHPHADTRWHLDRYSSRSMAGTCVYGARGLRRGGFGSPGPIPKKSEGRTETDERLRSNRSRDGQTAILWRCAERSGMKANTSPADEAIIGPRLLTCRFGRENDECNASSKPAQPEISFNTRRFYNTLQRSASSRAGPCACFALKLC
jgi:hypothetical protein